MNARHLRLDAVDREAIPVATLAVGLFLFGLVVHRVWALAASGAVLLALVPVASLAVGAWWELRDGSPLQAIGLGVAPVVGLASLPVYFALFGPLVGETCTTGACVATTGVPLQLQLMAGLLLGAGGYALAVLWKDVTDVTAGR